MEIVVRKSTIVLPAKETPKKKLWNSNLDLIMPPIHTPLVFFYRPNGAANFFDAKVMKDSLSRVLVAFYPMGGRLKEGKDGRIDIDCQGQGALFVEAEANSVIDDFGEFAPSSEVQKLIPTVDYSLGIQSYPLTVSQVTYFKCGGVSLGIGIHHYLADGISTMHFINSWSEIARGLDLTLPPFIDRTIFTAREPPQPVYEHIEYQPITISVKSSLVAPLEEPVVKIFKLTREQLNVLKVKSKQDDNIINYSTSVLLMGHIWKCVCRARGLPSDQETRFYLSTGARVGHQATLPPGYFGNVVLTTLPIGIAGEIQSNPSWYAAGKIHDALVTKKKDFLKSAIDYLELLPNFNIVGGGMSESLRSSNLALTSFSGLSIHDTDFGWGRPMFMGPGGIILEGLAFLIPSPIEDGSLSIIISLQAQHMKLFSKFLYEKFIMSSSTSSKL